MNGRKSKQIRKYIVKLREIHPVTYQDRTKLMRRLDGGVTLQWFSGTRLAKKHARLGLKLEKM